MPPILSLKGVGVRYPYKEKGKRRYFDAVSDVCFEVEKGDVLGIVGESGCGKSTLARAITGLVDVYKGSIIFDGIDITHLNHKERKPIRRRMQIIFQDPFSSLNPRMSIGASIREGLDVFKIGSKRERKERVVEMLELVGIGKDRYSSYPHEFSGGQRQRIAIARALILNPDIIIGDEITSALDVSIQAQILALLKDLQSRFSLTYIFISHDIAVVNYFCNKIVVMYMGEIVELGKVADVISSPMHPYTRLLIGSVPSTDPNSKISVVPQGDVPSPIDPPSGCRFHTRCPEAMDICKTQKPIPVVVNDRLVMCHLYK